MILNFLLNYIPHHPHYTNKFNSNVTVHLFIRQHHSTKRSEPKRLDNPSSIAHSKPK